MKSPAPGSVLGPTIRAHFKYLIPLTCLKLIFKLTFQLSGRRRNQYLFRQCYQLLNLEVESFSNDNYLYAIKIFENQKSHIMFSLPNKQDRQNFLQGRFLKIVIVSSTILSRTSIVGQRSSVSYFKIAIVSSTITSRTGIVNWDR